jgi:adenylate kinase
MDIVLFGIQGSGKGTQAKKLAAEFGYDIFEAGGELRKIKASGTELGKLVASSIDVGRLVPHEIIMRVVREAIRARPPDRRIIFDGIPRDLDQMRDFDAVMQETGRGFRCVQILCDMEKAVRRILGRAGIEGRTDDLNEEAIRKRMALFTEKTLPVIERYRARKNMTDIDGEGTIEEVYERLKKGLGLGLGQGYDPRSSQPQP